MSKFITSYVTALDELMCEYFTNYRGRIIEKVSDGYKVGSQLFQTFEDAKKAVDESFKINLNIQL